MSDPATCIGYRFFEKRLFISADERKTRSSKDKQGEHTSFAAYIKPDIIVVNVKENKGGIMKRGVIAAAAVLSMVFAVPVFAVEGTQPQPSTGAAPNFEQMKSDHLKRIDEKIKSLQEEKTCAEAAKNQNDLNACRKKAMRWGAPGKPGGLFSPQMK